MEKGTFLFLTTDNMDRTPRVIHAIPIDQRMKDPAKHIAKII
jgi:hypothetical protein